LRLALAILAFPVAIFLLSGLGYAYLAAQNPIPSEWRDLDCDGHVSPLEWLKGGIDYGMRPSKVSGCSELFALKDGLPVVVRCPTAPQCRIARELLPK